jgi:cysteine desulfurase / selenocysteine lyase
MSDYLTPKIRSDFPLLSKKIRGKSLVYLDSAATSLKPWPVIERLSQFYSYETANVHRGAHFLADQATTAFEDSRMAVKDFINAKLSEEIIFTKGTTESLNLIAQSWGRKNLKPGDEILLTEMEHHSNIVPWQMIAEERGAKIVVANINENGELDIEDFSKKLNPKVRLASFTACSNTLGTINDIKKLVGLCHANGSLAVVDGAQIVANHPIDISDVNADFFVFSLHKVFGPFGVGVLYGKKNILENLPPYQGGGSMIHQVTFEKTTFHDLPFKFEAGTPNISGVIAIKPALEYLQKIGWAAVAKHEEALLRLATNKLTDLGKIKVIGLAKTKAPVLSFVMEGVHPSDVGQILDQENIAVRTGHHCTQPLMAKFKTPGTVRASFSIYNNEDDVEKFIKSVEKAKELLLS